MILLETAGFLIAALVMVKAGEYAIKSLTAIGKNLKLAGFLISFLLVGIVSAFPEGFVSIISAIEGVPHLGFGALVGSAIADLSLVIGLVAIVAGRAKVKNTTLYEVWLLALLSLPVLLAADSVLSRTDGAVLVVGCLLFFYNIIRKNHIVDKLTHSDKRHLAKHLLLFALSAAFVFASAHFVVYFSQKLAAGFSIPLVAVGLVFVALATSIPETVLALTAARHKLADVAIGEVVGVIVIDTTLLLGTVAIISPIAIDTAELAKVAVFMLTSLALTTYFLQTGKEITWKEGTMLVMFYILFIIVEMTSIRVWPA